MNNDETKAISGLCGNCKHYDRLTECTDVDEEPTLRVDTIKTGRSGIKIPMETVNHPVHYMHEGIETINVIRAWTRHLDGYTGFLLGNAIKYISRWSDKGGVEDLKKAKWYLDEAIKEGKKNG